MLTGRDVNITVVQIPSTIPRIMQLVVCCAIPKPVKPVLLALLSLSRCRSVDVLIVVIFPARVLKGADRMQI